VHPVEEVVPQRRAFAVIPFRPQRPFWRWGRSASRVSRWKSSGGATGRGSELRDSVVSSCRRHADRGGLPARWLSRLPHNATLVLLFLWV